MLGREVSWPSLVDVFAGAEDLLEEQLGEGRREKQVLFMKKGKISKNPLPGKTVIEELK